MSVYSHNAIALWEETHILTQKPVDPLRCLYHVNPRTSRTQKMQYQLPNLSYYIQLFSEKHFFFQFVSNLFNFYSKISYYWKVARSDTRDFRAFIAFSKFPCLVLTRYKQQNWPPGFLVNMSVSFRSAILNRIYALIESSPWFQGDDNMTTLMCTAHTVLANQVEGLRGWWLYRGHSSV